MSERPSFSLLETMRWEPDGGFPFLTAHLGRLAGAAAFFGYPFDEAAIRAALDRATEGRTHHARVRLTLASDGTPTVTVAPLDSEPDPLRVACYPEQVEAGGPFWQHKTTHRPHYDAAYRWACARGLGDALLVNARGEVVEATRATVWIERDGRLLTPPLASGGLPGVYRAHLLGTNPTASEAVLTMEDVERASVVRVSNAVRGLVRAEVVPV